MENILRATYRLQFHPQFTFQDAIAITDYLFELNVSHIYASPYLQPAAGSMHGYDVADPTRINQELGGNEWHQKFCQNLLAKDLGLVVDIVPNHMSTKCPDNVWWMNVLKYGLASPYAEYFDIHWRSFAQMPNHRIVLPLLKDHYKKSIARKEIQLKYNQNIFTINYFDHLFPISPYTLISTLTNIPIHLLPKTLTINIKKLENLYSIIANNINKTPSYYSNLQKLEQKILKEIQNSESLTAAAIKAIEKINSTPGLMDKLLQTQNYYLTSWRTSKCFVGYRRFFHINTLVGLRVENKKTFMDSHDLILQWIKDGQIDGIRIDHIDGLHDPKEYLDRLRKLAPKTWIVAEKILLGKETLANDWPIEGTTGYDFLNLITELFIDSTNEKLFTDFYVNFIHRKTGYYAVLREKKLLVLNRLFGGDVNFLTELALQICQQHPIFKNFTYNELRQAIRELIACFPIYRTYIRAEQKQISETDKDIITSTINKAKKMRPNLNFAIFEFLKSVLLLQYSQKNAYNFIMRFQQLTGPAMAKGEEDTAFYCFNRFIALNEVGIDPSIFGISVENFHKTMKDNAKRQPYSMLTTSTHDTKRSEDVRARLAVLSEIPNAWFDIVQQWIMHNEKYHAENVPDRNTQYFLYQNLVGVWPITKERLLSFTEKAVREAKTYTSWFYPNHLYEQKLHSFVEEILSDKKFRSSLETFVAPLIKFGRINSLSQIAIKLTAPGIPDFYQGSELWNFTLVDPDNRKPINLQSHYQLFKEMKLLTIDDVMMRMDQGLPKLWLIYKTLALRKKHPELFNGTEYTSLMLQGEKPQHGVAFLRKDAVLTFTQRLVVSLKEHWGKTYLNIPAGNWLNILTEERFTGGKIMITDIIKKFPVAIFVKEG